MLSPGFEEHIETMFKLLNDQAIQSRLISMRLSCRAPLVTEAV